MTRTPRFAPGAGGGGAAPVVTNPYAGAEVFSLFVPGVVAAKTLGVWRNARPSGTARGLAIEANLLTGPTAGNAGNYWEILASDGILGSMALPISTPAVKHYAQNLGNAVVIARPKLNNGNPSGGALTLAVGIKFKPTQDLTVSGVIAATALSDFNDVANYGARALRASILDSTGALITSANAVSTGPTIADVQWTFPLSVVLLNGVTYYVVFDCIAAYTAIATGAGFANPGTDPGLALPTSYTTQTAPIVMIGNGGCILTASGGTTPRAGIQGQTVTQAVQGNLAAGESWTENNTPLGAIGLLGQGGSTVFHGDVTFTYASVGAPAAGAAGADVNMRILLGDVAA